MAGEMMLFPDTVEEFIEQYKVVDSDHTLSNGAEFIPVFRMRQWFDHLQAQPITNADRIRTMTDEELAEHMFRVQMFIFKSICDAIGYTEYDEKKMEHWDNILDWLKQEVE